jgi:hemerythrin
MDIWSLIELEKELEGKTLEEFKLWVKEEIIKEDQKMTQWHKEEAKAKKQGENK